MINPTVLDLVQTKASVYSPNLIILWAVMITLIPVMTWFLKTKKTNWGRFWVSWFFVVLFSGLVLILFLSSPSFVTDFYNTIIGFIFS